jgi:hypothetical protein
MVGLSQYQRQGGVPQPVPDYLTKNNNKDTGVVTTMTWAALPKKLTNRLLRAVS